MGSNGDNSMETAVTSHGRTVRIGPQHPFVIIGERINPTGRKSLAAEMAAGNFERVRADALAQVAAGAQMLDVNAGIPLADEPAILAETIRVVQSVTDVPLSIDSSIVAALEQGLAAYRGKPLVNSVTGEEERLQVVLPLIAKYGAAVVGVANDETGIPGRCFAALCRGQKDCRARGSFRDSTSGRDHRSVGDAGGRDLLCDRDLPEAGAQDS